MLKLAKPYESQLHNLFTNVVYEDKFKFYNCSNYYDYNLDLANNSWNQIEYVSVDKNNNVIGFLAAKVDRCN